MPKTIPRFLQNFLYEEKYIDSSFNCKHINHLQLYKKKGIDRSMQYQRNRIGYDELRKYS